MDQKTLRKYQQYYRSARYLGSDELLRAHLGLEKDLVLPLGIAHGVDFGQTFSAMDVNNCEPIYWAYNERSFEKARKIKPTLLLPHPYLLAARKLPRRKGKGAILIGPPPGPVHDEDLLARLRDRTDDITILVKPKLGVEHSLNLWRERGFKAITLAGSGVSSYASTAELFSRYEKIISPYLSSTIFFASALGKSVELITDFVARTWETPHLFDFFDFDSATARKNAEPYLDGDQKAMEVRSLSLLGADIEASASEQKAALMTAIEALKSPLHVSPDWPSAAHPLLRWTASKVGRTGFLSYGLAETRRRLGRHRVLSHQLNEIALWRDGPTPNNPQIDEQPYRPGVTVPGAALSQYDV